MKLLDTVDMTIAGLLKSYRENKFSPIDLIDHIYLICEKHKENPIWIELLSKKQIKAHIDKLASKSVDELPLYGIPFAIKDNIDLAGVPTTAGCEEFAYTPNKSATVVQNLLDAGAIPIGKTNLDQFATGLNGTRSPWGAVQNSFNKEYVSGGSSAGSPVAVALGMASFSLGTDTAGSGRVPAAFNNLIGLKPSRGLISASGVVPACQSLDCVSIFALTPDDSAAVLAVAESVDQSDLYSRPRGKLTKAAARASEVKIGIPAKAYLEFYGDDNAEQLFNDAVKQWQTMGAEIVEIDFQPFVDAASLLYYGPWVAERYAAIEELVSNTPEVLNPTIRKIIEPACKTTAVDGFKAFYELQGFKKIADASLASVDFIMMPTSPTIYTIDELLDRPVELNNRFGHYTNFVNLFDYSAVAIPAGFLDKGLPWGVTLVAQAFSDNVLLSYAQKFLTHTYKQQGELKVGALDLSVEPLPMDNGSEVMDKTIDFVVCGAHLSGMVLNPQLVERNAVLVKTTTTSDNYCFYALAGGPPFRPGLVRDEVKGQVIDVEVWRMPIQHFGSLMQLIPHPLGIGTVELSDGSWCKGFICEPCGIEGAQDITEMKSWRTFIASIE